MEYNTNQNLIDNNGEEILNNPALEETIPVYYSERAVYGFTFFFGVIFGSVLMAINIKNKGSKKGLWAVIVFGILYTILTYTIINYVPIGNHNSSESFLFNIMGAAIIRYFFWPKYIGKEVVYKNKPIWMPLIIGVIIFSFLLFIAIYGRSVS